MVACVLVGAMSGFQQLSAQEPEPAAPEAAAPANAAPEIPADDEIEIFAPPVDWYDTALRRQVIQVVSQVRLLLKEDWSSKKSDLQNVVDRYLVVHGMCPDDGRLPFAWGLYFWKVGNARKARSAFEHAVVQSPRFLAGHQAVAWANFELRETERGLTSLEGLLAAIQEPAAEYPSANQKRQAAEWLGQAVGYLQGTSLTPPQVERIQQLEQKLAALPADLRTPSLRGRQQSLERASELKTILTLAPERLQENFVEQLNKTRQQLAVCELRIDELQREKQDNADEVNAAQQSQTQRVLAMRQLTQQITIHLMTANRLMVSSYGEVVEKEVEDNETEKQKDGSIKIVKRGKKTIRYKLPETAAETAQRMNDIQMHRASAQNKTQMRSALQSQSKTQRGFTNALTSEAAKFKNTVAMEWDALHTQQRALKQQLSRIESWQTDPQLFANYVRTVDPYVPWDVEVLRQQLLDSMTLTDAPPVRPMAVASPR